MPLLGILGLILAVGDGEVDPRTLLDRYEGSILNSTTWAIKAEGVRHMQSAFETTSRDAILHFDYFRNGTDRDLRFTADGSGPAGENISLEGEVLSTEFQFLTYQKTMLGGSVDQASVNYSTAPEHTVSKEMSHLEGALGLEGYLAGDSVSVFEIMAETKTLSMDVQPDSENVRCYVIDAQNDKWGHYQLWLDPTTGQLRKAVVEKSSADLYGIGTPLSERRYPEKMRLYRYVLDSIAYKEVDGKSIPIGCRWETVTTFETGKATTVGGEFGVSEVALKPDFDALGAFKPEIPDGTPVYWEEFSDIKHEWRAGQVVPGVSPKEVKSLVSILEESQNISSKVTGNPLAKAQTIPDESIVDRLKPRGLAGWLTISLVVLLGGFLACWQLSRRFSKKEANETRKT